MVRLNKHLPSPPEAERSAAQTLLADLFSDGIRDVQPPPTIDFDAEQPHPTIKDFFEKYYSRNTQMGLTHPAVQEKMTRSEQHLVRYLASAHSPDLYILRDHGGKGKSTLLKYVVFYLHPTEAGLRRNMVPIYISTQQHTELHNLTDRKELLRFLDQRIKTLAFPLTDAYLQGNCRAVLSWANKRHSALQGRFSTAKLSKLERALGGFETYLSDLADQDGETFREIHLATLAYYSQNERQVILVIDDADRDGFPIQRTLLEYLFGQLRLGFKCVFSIRNSTYQTIEAQIRDRDTILSPGINNTPSKLKGILLKRLTTVAEEIRLEARFRAEAMPSQVVEAVIDMISAPTVGDLFVKTSNENLHTLFRKLQLVPRSYYFSDDYILREILASAIKNQNPATAHGAKLWVALSLLLGNYKGSFMSDDDMAHAGLVNIFCVQNLNHYPHTYFIRLHILASLIDRTTEARTRQAKRLQADYDSVFGFDMALDSSLKRSIFRLTQSKLIFTKTFTRYQEEDQIDFLINNDSLFLAPAGEFYLRTLFSKVDYLYFLKDDIDWPEASWTDLKFRWVVPGSSRDVKFEESLKALVHLMHIEYSMLEQIVSNAIGPVGDKTRLYDAMFSARRLGAASGLFTDFLLGCYCNYFRRIGYTISQPIRDSIHSVGTAHCELRRCFGYPEFEASLHALFEPTESRDG
ncbi:MAG: hypothetical protein K8J08_22680 [Thermoanaerobaculia bacterium]|nr:hypothetical protein [Thermoanaerobaculia bacterium]